NFDGWKDHDKKGHNIQPFQSQTGKRSRDIQEILYRSSEIFAPFNVRVIRIYGEGKYDQTKRGNTTIFVGAHTENVKPDGHKYPFAVTPGKYSDFAVPSKPKHQPNSDPYDIAFVDPVGERKHETQWSTVWDNTIISRKI